MTTFFNLPEDLLLSIYQHLSPAALFSIGTTGNEPIRRVAFKALFQKESKDALKKQEELLELWQAHSSTYMPDDKVILHWLTNQDISYKLFALTAMIKRKESETSTKMFYLPSSYMDYLYIKMQHSDRKVRNDAVYSLKKIAAHLGPFQLDRAITTLTNNVLPHEKYDIYSTGYQALKELWIYLHSEQYLLLFNKIVLNLQDAESFCHRNLKILELLIPHLNNTQLITAQALIQQNLKHQDYLIGEQALIVFNLLIQNISNELLTSTLNQFLTLLQNKEITPKELMAFQSLIPSMTASQLSPTLITILNQLKPENKQICINALQLSQALAASDVNPEELLMLLNTLCNLLGCEDKKIRQEALETCILFGTRMTEQQITPIIDAVLNNLQQEKKEKKIQALKDILLLAKNMPLTKRLEVIDLVRKKLQDSNFLVRSNAKTTLKELIVFLDPTQRLDLFNSILIIHFTDESSVRESALDFFSILAPYVSTEDLIETYQFLLTNLQTNELKFVKPWLDLAAVLINHLTPEQRKPIFDWVIQNLHINTITHVLEMMHKFLQNRISLLDATQKLSLLTQLLDDLLHKPWHAQKLALETLSILINFIPKESSISPLLTPLVTSLANPQNNNIINAIPVIAAYMSPEQLTTVIDSLIANLPPPNSFLAHTLKALRHLVPAIKTEQWEILLPLLDLQHGYAEVCSEILIILEKSRPHLDAKQLNYIFQEVQKNITHEDPRIRYIALLASSSFLDLIPEENIISTFESFALDERTERLCFDENKKQQALLNLLHRNTTTPSLHQKCIHMLTQITNNNDLPDLVRQRSLNTLSAWLILALKDNDPLQLLQHEQPDESVELLQLSLDEDTDEYIELQVLANLCSAYRTLSVPRKTTAPTM